MEYDSARKKKEILLYPTAWMDTEGVALSAVNQTETDKCLMWNLRHKVNGSAGQKQTIDLGTV